MRTRAEHPVPGCDATHTRSFERRLLWRGQRSKIPIAFTIVFLGIPDAAAHSRSRVSQRNPSRRSIRVGNHGRVVQAHHSSDGMSAGADSDLQFAIICCSHHKPAMLAGSREPCCRDMVPMHWHWIPRNIVEGDGSFALFVDTDVTLVSSFFGLPMDHPLLVGTGFLVR